MQTMDIQSAVERLAAQLPLKARQERLPAALKTLHQQILFSLVNAGRPPTLAQVHALVGPEYAKTALQRLGADDLIVLDAGQAPVGAYPLTLEQTRHTIFVNGHQIYAMCALDAVAVAPMFNTQVRIESFCHASGTPITIRMSGDNVLEAQPSAAITIGIRWQPPSAVAAHSMCMEMVFFKDKESALAWQQQDPDSISLFGLAQAIQFGKAFFLPLLN